MEQTEGGSPREEGMRLLKAGQVDEAIAIWGDLCRKEPDDAQLHMLLGIAYGAKNDKLHAIHHLETSINIEENPKTLYNLGLIYESAHRVDEAVRQYKMAVHLDPSYTLAQQALDKLQSQYEAAHAPAPIVDETVQQPDGVEQTIQQPAAIGAAVPAPGAQAFAPPPPSGPPDYIAMQAQKAQEVKDAHRALIKKGVIYGAVCGAILFVLLSLLGGMLIAAFSARAGIVYLAIQGAIGAIYGSLIGLWIGFTAGDENAGAQAGAVLAFIYGFVQALASGMGIGFAVISACVNAVIGAIGGYIIGRMVDSSIQQI